MLASSSNVLTLFLQSVIGLNYPDYVLTGWHTSLIIISVILVLALVNIYGIKTLPWVLTVAGILHIALFFFFVVVMAVMGRRNDARYVFFEKNVEPSGWDENPFVSWYASPVVSVLYCRVTPYDKIKCFLICPIPWKQTK